MATFAENLEHAAGDEAIECIVIGAYGWNGFKDDDDVRVPESQRNVVLPWSEARPLLMYEHDTGYGAPECNAVTAWTATRVLFVVQYDGSTSVHSVPRNPEAHTPIMPGG